MRAALRPRAPWVVGLSYAAALLLVDLFVSARPDGGESVRLWWSTNLDNLSSEAGAGRAVAVLVGSAFVPEESAGWWALFAVAGLVVAARRIGALRTVLVVGAVHVAATVVSEIVFLAHLPQDGSTAAERSIVDVGPSYVVVAALTVAVLYGRRWERAPAAVAFLALAPYLFVGLGDREVAPVGHTASIVLAAALGGALARRARTPGPAPVPSGVRR